MGGFFLHLCLMNIFTPRQYVNLLYTVLISLAFTLFFSCSQKVEISGLIFERKVLPQNKLQIKYRYQFGEKKYVDSAVVSNKILPVDTIQLHIDTRNPEKAQSDLFSK